jgi:hypothetical protein
MRCWNCNRALPKKAKACAHCEAAVLPETSPEEIEAARQILDNLPPEVMADLQQAFLESDTAEEFSNRLLVGPCPKCGSSETGDCEDDPEINELLLGRCYECGQLWCTECEKVMEGGATSCPCWEEDVEEE